MLSVIVVPETSEFIHDVSHGDVVWINKKLGVPHLETHNARYLAPLWLGVNLGVYRIYHILSADVIDNLTEIRLGNSFVLRKPWRKARQHRRFEYHDLSEFGFVEHCPGIIVPIQNLPKYKPTEALDFMESTEAKSSQNEENFFAVAGLWQGRDVDQAKLWQQAWPDRQV